MEKVNLLGVAIDNLSLQEVLESVKKFLTTSNQHYIVTPNPEFLVAAYRDEHFKEILNYADLAVADGVGLIHAAKFLGKRLVRVTGVDLMFSMCELAEQQNSSVYLLGGDEMVAAETAERLREYFPKLRITGAESGGEIVNIKEPDVDLIGRVNDAAPDILFVAFGQIKQEEWIFYHLDQLPPVKIAVGVGGSFDYISGNISRAPGFLRRIGLEWIYRLIREPWRYRRVFNAAVVFPLLILKEKIVLRFKK